MRILLACSAACALALLVASASSAGVVNDAQGDWYSTTPETHRADLDVKTADGLYEDNVGWHVSASMWGAIDPTQPGSYVWGFGRGSSAAVAPFAGEANVKFDAVLSYSAHDGTASVRLLDTGVTTALDPSKFGYSGDTISAFIPEELLPTVQNGFSDDAFTWNLWPRLPGGPATNIADFAPDNAMEPFTTVPAGSVPEPSSLTLLLGALPLAGIAVRRRR
ncbi:MAG TPA: PEP-CTERM sorting domain-containing protein [Armatimonadota bacterium]|jgi:hypothetical protein